MTLDPDFVRKRLTAWKARGAFYQPDDSIAWMGGGAGAFFAMPQDDTTVRLFLTGRDKTIRTRVGIVTLKWTDRPQVMDVTPEPVIDLGELGTFDMDGVSYPWIVRHDGALFMYYVGWNRLGGSLTIFPSALESAMPPRNSRNCVERMIVYGMPEVLISFSCASLARK